MKPGEVFDAKLLRFKFKRGAFRAVPDQIQRCGETHRSKASQNVQGPAGSLGRFQTTDVD
jgi:hypothetical protein